MRRSRPFHVLRVLRPGADSTTALAWSEAGGELASGSINGVVRIWDPQDGALTDSFAVSGTVTALSWSTDRKRLAIGTDEALYLYAVRRQSLKKISAGQIRGVRTIQSY